ncbi:hypothetical protein J3459_007735 [Metarhizium acridum]|nr:hypothetical protein J3459_007735 [Metarhizium acridum]
MLNLWTFETRKATGGAVADSLPCTVLNQSRSRTASILSCARYAQSPDHHPPLFQVAPLLGLLPFVRTSHLTAALVGVHSKHSRHVWCIAANPSMVGACRHVSILGIVRPRLESESHLA